MAKPLPTPLSVQQRISAAIQLARFKNPGRPVNVSELCRIAKISRSNLYATYPKIIEDIQNSRSKSQRKTSRSITDSQARLQKLKLELEARNKVLLFLALELKHQLQLHQSRSAGTRRLRRPD